MRRDFSSADFGFGPISARCLTRIEPAPDPIRGRKGANLPISALGRFRQIPSRRRWDTKPRLLASIEKAEQLIGYKPFVEFEEGIKTNMEWFRDNWDKIEVVADFAPGMSSAVR